MAHSSVPFVVKFCETSMERFRTLRAVILQALETYSIAAKLFSMVSVLSISGSRSTSESGRFDSAHGPSRWREAYNTATEVCELMNKAKTKPKTRSEYFEYLGQIFWKSDECREIMKEICFVIANGLR